MDCIANGCGGYRPCKTKQVQLDVTDAILHFIGDGSALSHLNASNVDFGTLTTSVFPASGVTAGTYGSSSNISQVTVDQYGRVTAATNVASVSSQWTGVPGSTIYYIDGVSIGTSADATSNLQVVGNVYVSNALSTTNVYATTYYGDGGLLSNIASQWTGTKGSPIYYVPNVSVGSSDDATSNLQVTGNVYVSNTVTVPNVHVTDTLDVTGALTANAANATFFFDTFTIPYINTQVLNVSSSTTLTGNLVAETANIATLNVGYLTVNSAVVYGATTLNVYGVSNLSTVTANTLSMSGDVFIGNVAITGAVQTTTGPMSRLTFDNTANTSIYPNKIVLYANTASSQYCGFGVTNLGPTGGASIAYGARQNHIFNTGTTLNTEIMRIAVGGTVGIGTATAAAKLHVGTSLTQNVQVLVEASNVAIATTGGGRVGFGTSTPSANLHVIGNVYASNALTTTNVFATTEILTGTTGATTLNVTGNLYVSNAVTTTNVFATTANVGTLNVWQVSNLSTLNVTGNVYASNAVTTTNLFATNGLDVGPGTLGSNVVIFSNISGGSNVFVMDSNGRIGIGTASPGAQLDVYSTASASPGATVTNSGGSITINAGVNAIYFSTGGTVRGYFNAAAFGPNADLATNLGYASGPRWNYVNAGTVNLNGGGANVYAANAVTTTNVFAATEILTGTTGTTTLNVTGNLYVSNAVTTTNLFTAGITSNAVSTVFNFDTLTIPFISCTTLNVASTSNLDTVTLTGEPGLTTLFASGNAYVSNALTTTNVFASDIILASSTLGTVVAGQMEYNTYLYGTINTTSGRGSVPIDYIYRLTTPTAAYGIASNNFFTGTATGTGARLNLEASSVYDIEAYCLFTKTTDGTVTWILATSSAPTLITAAYTASPTAGISGGAPVTSYVGGVTTTVTFQTTGTLTGGFSHSFLFKIQVLTNLATTFGITATQSAGTMTSLAGSYYRVTKLSTTTGAFT
jgi:hypothetical protein